MKDKNMTGYPSIDRPWLKYYRKEDIDSTLPECSIYEYMYENNKNYPRDIAINYFGRKITYAELFTNIDKTAKAFQAVGVKKGEIVTVALPSIPEALYVVYALNKIGAVANMIHPLAGKNEIIGYLNEVKSRVAVIFDKTMDIIGDGIRETSVEQAVVVTAGYSLSLGLKIAYSLKNKASDCKGVFKEWEDFIKNGKKIELKPYKKDCHTMAIISHTGGTTGEPKGVMCSDYNVNSLMLQSISGFKHDERQHCALAVLPPFVNYSLISSMLEMLAIGYIVVLLPKYEPAQIWNYISKYHPNVVLSIPAYWEKLLDKDKCVDMTFFEQIYYGGESMSQETESAINDVLRRCGSKTELLKGLGSTELTSVASQTYPWCNDIGSVGIPLLKMNCKIVNPETYVELPYNSDGEICFTGPTLMLGYYNNEMATNEVIKVHSDGKRWLHTGDLGHITEDGVIYVTGRIKRIVMTKGQDGQVTKLFPDRIEKAIYSVENVELCCVVGVPDERRINIPKAYVVLKHGNNDVDGIKDEILQQCHDALPEYMVPEMIEIMDDLPRTPRGKVDYRVLENR